jgi:hypothetical protein
MYWGKTHLNLPIRVQFTYEFHGPGEMIAAWSNNELNWGQGGDALTMDMSTNRHDFTFRTKVFGGFPSVSRP